MFNCVKRLPHARKKYEQNTHLHNQPIAITSFEEALKINDRERTVANQKKETSLLLSVLLHVTIERNCFAASSIAKGTMCEIGF